MNRTLRIALHTSPRQHQQLRQLQQAFAAVCNALAPLVRETRCWNRVALHHMAYKQLRERFPELGSQMVCNAIYSVSRASRHVYQHPDSLFNLARLGDRPLPRLQFVPTAPVYFDRHTLSIKAGQVSMYTLDGRIRFELGLNDHDEQRFRNERLREIVLTSSDKDFFLAFHFAQGAEAEDADDSAQSNSTTSTTSAASAVSGDLPEYVLAIDDAQMPGPTAHPTAQAVQLT
ncbi:MAG: hypothetical protein IPH51_05700 [Rubrivivax sp.]|nr:hypothetical protein [Rubrivivax sp.]